MYAMITDLLLLRRTPPRTGSKPFTMLWNRSPGCPVSPGKTCTLLLLALLGPGCSIFTDTGKKPAPEITEAPPLQEEVSKESDLPPKPFAEETLYNLLVGELAVYDRDLATAAESYRREAINTRDIAVTERAARLTRYLRDEAAAIEMAELWYELAPQSTRAADNLADLYARANRPIEALDILQAQFESGQPAKFGLLRNTSFGSKATLDEALARLAELDEGHSHNNFSLVFTRTLLLQKSGQTEAALQQLKRLKRFESEPAQLALIESQLLSELEKHREAAEVLEKARKKSPDDRRLAVAHARKLTKFDLPAAEEELTALLDDSPEDIELLMTHALVAAENANFDAARASLNKLLALKQKASFAHFNLGLIARQQEDLDTALTHFEKVDQGQHYLSAIDNIVEILAQRGQITEAREYLASVRARFPMLAPTAWSYEARLLADNQQAEKALRVLSTALLQFPEQHHLRMQRSYISDSLGRTDLAEQDLRYVLEREPNNPDALNALGYILADRTTRYTEARELIEKAIALVPENAAIIDSLGWVMYKQGDAKGAIEQLEKAFSIMPEDEVAAHLVEVYWQNSQPSAARKIYNKLRKLTKEHPKLDETMQRLDIRF